MKEELIRIENGQFQTENGSYQFDISISRGECIGIYVDEHLTSDTAYLNIFKGGSHIKNGKVFLCGARVGSFGLERWIRQNSMVVDKCRFNTKELTAWDFVIALGKPMNLRQKARAEQRLRTEQAAQMLREMGLHIAWNKKLVELTPLEYYALAVFRAWFQNIQLLVLDRFTEILRRRDLERLMRCVQLLLGQGAAVLLFDMDETFLYQYVNRLDVIKNRRTCFRLYPEEFDDRLYTILGWERRSGGAERPNPPSESRVVLSVSGLTFPALPPMRFQIRSGEIALLRDENYQTVSSLRSCFLGERGWLDGELWLDGRRYTHRELSRIVGTKIGIQVERPNRPNGVLFENMTALDNLSICLLPKAGQHMVRRQVTDSILHEASRWFDRDALLRPLSEWSLPERLRFSYFKWYLLNPALLICFFPFAGLESAYHEMVIELLVTCARRGMAVWIVSSGIDAICEKTENIGFLERLHDIGE